MPLKALFLVTSKNFLVVPDNKVPYLISVCFTKSSGPSMGVCMRSMVRKAARFAV